MSNPRGTHPLNVSYLVLGLVFLGMAGSWALKEAGVVDLSGVRWLFPATLVVAGLIGVVAMAAKGLNRREDTSPDGGHDSQVYDPQGYDYGAYDTYEGEGR